MPLPCCFVLGLLSSTAWAQAPGSADLRVARQLTAAGLSCNIDGDGGYRIPNFLHRQSATLSPRRQLSNGYSRRMELRRIWTLVACLKAGFPARSLASSWSTFPKLDSWSIALSDTTSLPVSPAVLPAEASPELLKTVIVGATANELQTHGASGSVPSPIHS